MPIKRYLIALIVGLVVTKGASAATTEIAPSKTLALAPSHSRVLITREIIKHALTSDPEIAEPIVCSKNLIVLLGKKPGSTTFSIKDASGKIAVYTIEVTQKNLLYPNDLNSLDSVKTVTDADIESVNIAFSAMNKDLIRIGALKHKIELYSKISKKPSTPTQFSTSELAEASAAKENFEIPMSQALIFKSTENISTVTSSDYAVLQPVQTSTSDYALIGKKPGVASIKFKDRSGKSNLFRVTITKPVPPQIVQNWLPLVMDEFLWEQDITKNLSIESDKPKLLGMKARIVRMAIGDPGIADPIVVDEQHIVLIGKQPGETSLFVWDEAGRMEGIHVIVEGYSSRCTILKAAVEIASASHIVANSEKLLKTANAWQIANNESVVTPPNLTEIVIWSGAKKDILSVPNN